MSMDPQVMAQMLAGQLGSGQSQGGGPIASQQSSLGAGAALAQKIMLMQALQRQPQQPQQPGMPQPQPNIMGQIGAQPQALQAQQMPGGVNV